MNPTPALAGETQNASVTPLKREEIEQRVAHMFRRARTTGTGEALYRAVLEFRLENRQ